MRTVARGLLALVEKPVGAVSVILGLLVSVFLGGPPNDTRAPTSTFSVREGGTHPRDRDG